jgi:large subunit ribosomal protein L22
MRVVANLVRKKKVEEAVGLLELMPKKAARLIVKAVKSAVANAEDRSGGDLSVEDLKIHAITVDGGPVQKRWMPRSMGRANRIIHRSSHLTVVVSDED